MTNKILNLFEIDVSFCRWLFVYKKCKLASLFSLTPHSLIEGGVF